MRRVGGVKRDVREDAIFWGTNENQKKREVGTKQGVGARKNDNCKEIKGEKEVRKVDRRKDKVQRKKEKKMKGETVTGYDAGLWRRGRKMGRRHPALRPQGLLGRGQPISLSLINSSRGDCNTAGDC